MFLGLWKKISIKGSIIAEIKKAVSKKEFANYLRGRQGLYRSKDVFKIIDNTWSWEEIAYVTSKGTKGFKLNLLKYYKKVKNERNQSGGKRN